MKSVSFNIDINTTNLSWSDIEQLYDIIESAIRGKKLYSNEYNITTIIT